MAKKLNVGKEGSLGRSELKDALKEYVNFMSNFNDKNKIKAVINLAMETGRLYLGAMHLLEQVAYFQHRKGWAKQLSQGKTELTKEMQEWTKKPKEDELLVDGLAEEMASIINKRKKANKSDKKTKKSKKKSSLSTTGSEDEKQSSNNNDSGDSSGEEKRASSEEDDESNKSDKTKKKTKKESKSPRPRKLRRRRVPPSPRQSPMARRKRKEEACRARRVELR
eukprot:3895870-Amphidinium_carterae.3